MSYQFIDEGPTILKVIDNGREILFKKVYCSTAIDGDYFIDCSGFSKVLNKEMDCGWVSYKDNLPVNSALPYIQQFQKDEDIKPETLAWAMPNGWMWQIPTQQRYGCGYVYCDKFVSDEKALEELEKTTNVVNRLCNKTYRNKKLWVQKHPECSDMDTKKGIEYILLVKATSGGGQDIDILNEQVARKVVKQCAIRKPTVSL